MISYLRYVFLIIPFDGAINAVKIRPCHHMSILPLRAKLQIRLSGTTHTQRSP